MKGVDRKNVRQGEDMQVKRRRGKETGRGKERVRGRQIDRQEDMHVERGIERERKRGGGEREREKER